MEKTLNITKSVTFEVEKLQFFGLAKQHLPIAKILEKFDRKIEAIYQGTSTIIDTGYHPFINTIYLAYSEHRPLVLSPDMLWLIINQGFSMHVNVCQGTEKDIFPNKKRKTLKILNNSIVLGQKSPWHETTAQLCEQISQEIGEDLINILRADFSTTGINERVVSEIMIMDTMKSYFEYIVFSSICGIPKITLEGIPKDWERLQEKTTALKGYGIDDWIEQLLPLLSEFVKASKGEVDVDFWRNLFKVHTSTKYGNPKTIDGWITHFYPYDRDGNRFILNQTSRLNIDDILELLPKEVATVNFKHQVLLPNGKIHKSTDMEYWGGFLGTTEERSTKTLRPEIGWFVAYLPEQLKPLDLPKYSGELIYRNLETFPLELLAIQKEFMVIELHFLDEIKIPDTISTLDVRCLKLEGKITIEEQEKVKKLLPHTQISFS